MAKKKKKGASGKGKKSGTGKKKRSLSVRLLKWAVILSLWAGIFAIVTLAWFAKDLPDITRAAKFDRRPSITILANDGSVIARYGETKGRSVTISELPTNLINAVIATEDRRFYSHPGIDLLGISRAMLINLSKGHLVQGGSTITQQLAKNLFLNYDRTLKRKIQEAMLAVWLEWHLSKDQILAAYLNRVYLGSGIYGVDAASEIYFGKSVSEINLRESAILAGLLKAPSRYSPLANPDLALERSDVVLEAMADAGYITQEEAKKVPRTLRKPPGGGSVSKDAGYFADWVLNSLDELIGTPDMDLVVETTLDPQIQKKAEESLVSQLKNNGEKLSVSQGAALVMRPDGAILCMIGGRDRRESEFNRATQALRPPGSSFKPLVYVTALEKGWRSDSMILDAPITEGKYRPDNFGGKYYGEVTLQEALTHSMNTAAVRLMKNIGVSSVINTARQMGITANLEPDLSLSLGSSGISMLEMTAAYASLANGGYGVTPYAVIRIKDSNNTVVYEKIHFTPKRILEGPAVKSITRMMERVIEQGTGQRARLPFPASGKTGTSQDYRDAWFIGFTSEMVTAVWLGNDDNSPMKKVTGGSTPAEIWKTIMASGRGKYKPVVYANNWEPANGNNENSQGFSGMLSRILNSDVPKFKPKDRDPKNFSNLND
ncbi:MAG: penicillin-binding protein [Alphaproteobacteria bacterium]|nr:penicillin-binding protein [Alphaproteobacteria bacterium]